MKLYQAQQFLETKKESSWKGAEDKSAWKGATGEDRASPELGMRASEIDEQLAEVLDETAAAGRGTKVDGAEAGGAAHRPIQPSKGAGEEPHQRTQARPSTRKPRTWTRA